MTGYNIVNYYTLSYPATRNIALFDYASSNNNLIIDYGDFSTEILSISLKIYFASRQTEAILINFFVI